MKREPYPVQSSGTVPLAPSTGTFLNNKPGLSKPPRITRTLFAYKALVEEYLASLAFSDNPRLAHVVGAMRYALLAGDERLRPVLCMGVASDFGRDPVEVLPAAAAIELIHTFSLIHDDLPATNRDERRRGIPGCHEKFGEATAILAGDGFFGESLALITAHQKGTPEQLTRIVRELARSAGVDGIVGGLVLNVSHAGHAVDPETLNAVHTRKTGALIEASARIGAILAGATLEEQEIISEYARKLGLCFQASSDILNTVPAAKGLDEDLDSGAEPGEATFVSVYGLSKTRRLAEESYEGALEALERVDRDTSGLAALVRFVRHGARCTSC